MCTPMPRGRCRGRRRRDRSRRELTLDPVELLVPPSLAVAGLDSGNYEAIGGKGSIAKNAGLLDVRDGPPVGGQLPQRVEQLSVKVPPLVRMLEVGSAPPVTGGSSVGMQVPSDTETLRSSDRPQESVLHEISHISDVTILHVVALVCAGASAVTTSTGQAPCLPARDIWTGATPGGQGPACENTQGPASAPGPRPGGSLPYPP